MNFITTALLFFLILLPTLNAGEAFFRPVSRQTIELTEGDSFRGVIELWNLKNISTSMISKMKGETFLNSFYVVSLSPPRWSENNPEVIIVEGLFILEKKSLTNEHIWKVGGIDVPVLVKEIISHELDSKEDKFIVIEKQYDFSENSYRLIAGVAVLILLFLVIIFLKQKRKKSFPLNSAAIDWKGRLKNAKSLDDFSEIYLNKDSWPTEFGKDSKHFKEYLRKSEKIIFKKNPKDSELDELRVSLDSILNSVKV